MPQLHALIIDDNPSNVEVLALLLANEGVDSTSVGRISELEALLQTVGHVDVVFLDLELPNSSGLTLLSKLRASPQIAGARIIAYTVHVSKIDAARQNGFDGFLGKPLQVSAFPDQLRSILAGEPVWVY